MYMKKDEKQNIALYRKYRPQNFSEVIGQDHIVHTIKGAIEAGKVSHAYLLCGPRGTGKTTIARIIAKALGTNDNDIYEMDGASNRKIEDARNIRENINTLPFDSKYKVYILDEVHMLTKEAWNALLKTIEEPPEYVVFILATTEFEKIPETIVSRCQTFTFKKPNENILCEVVKDVAKKEGYSMEDGGAELIALLGDGSFRDTLSTLDKVISFSKDKKITRDEIATVTGSPKITLVEDFLQAIANTDSKKGYEVINLAVAENVDMKVYFKMILSHLRYALMLRYAPKMKSEIGENLSEHDLNFLLSLIENKPKTISSNSLSILLESYQTLRYAFIPQIPLEMALIKILEW